MRIDGYQICVPSCHCFLILTFIAASIVTIEHYLSLVQRVLRLSSFACVDHSFHCLSTGQGYDFVLVNYGPFVNAAQGHLFDNSAECGRLSPALGATFHLSIEI